MMARALVFLAAAAFSCANSAQQSSHIGGTLEAGSPTATVMMSAGASDPEGWASFLRPSRKGGPVAPWDGRSATSANRSFARPFLTAPPSDHAAAGRDTEGPVDDPGKALAGPTAIADKHGTIKQRIAWCESRGHLDAVNPVSGASGPWQFLDATFEAATGLPGKASDYPLSVQSEAFDELFAQQGTRPWRASKGCWSR